MNIGEEICGSYLKYVKQCDFVDYNINTTNSHVGQGEIDVIGINQANKIVYVCEVAVHIATGLQYTKDNKPNVYNKVSEKFQRDIKYVIDKFPNYRIVPMFWSPIVKQTSSNPAQTDLRKVKDSLKSEFQKPTDLRMDELCLIINEQWKSCVEELREKAKRISNELSGVMRVFQIEEFLNEYLSRQ